METNAGQTPPTPVYSHGGLGQPRPWSVTRKPLSTDYQPLAGTLPPKAWRAAHEDDSSFAYSTSRNWSEPLETSHALPASDVGTSPPPPQSLPVQGWNAENKRSKSGLVQTLLQCVFHVVPVLVTVTLFVLNARKVYWKDADASNVQAMILQAFQFPVKAHEIAMTASIAAVILHRVRHDLFIRQDLPLGLLTSPFRVGDVTYFFSREFRQAIFDRLSFRQLNLAALIVGGTVLTLLVGPSSGVLMIPKLAWWDVKNPFGLATDSIYYNTTRENHWPAVMSKYDCGAWGCPNSGVPDLTTWGQNLMREHVTPQLTYFGGSSFRRAVTSNSTNYDDGWTASTSLTMRDAEAIGSFWNYVVMGARGPERLRKPRLLLQPASGQSLLKALVQVQCSAQKAGTATQFPRSSLHGTSPGVYDNVNWPLPEPVASWTPDPIDSLDFSFVSVEGLQNAPSLAGVFWVVRSEDQQPMIVPCSILAHWVPTKVWIDPKTDLNSHDALQNPLQAFDADRSQWKQISFSDGWLDMMGTDIVQWILQQMTLDTNSTMRSGFEGLSWRLSTVLGLLLTDNIARYSAEAPVMVYHDGPDGEYAYSDIGVLSYGPATPPDGFQSWSQYIGQASLMKIDILVNRYGYGWSFRGIVIKVAAAILALHTLLAVGHLVVLLSSKWTSTACSSLGNVIALTLHSDIVKHAGLSDSDSTDAHGEKRLWKLPVKVSRDLDDHVRLGLSRSAAAEHGEVHLVGLS